MEVTKGDGVFYDYIIKSRFGHAIDVKETSEGIIVRPHNSNPCLYQGIEEGNKQSIMFSDPQPKCSWKKFRSLDNQY
jgi:hypothetical protein